MEYSIWLNGEYSLRSEAKISMLDRGFRMGDVVFDTLRTFDGKLFKLREHLERLDRSLKYTRIDPGMSMEKMGALVQEVVDYNESVREPGDDYMITPLVTRGTASAPGASSDPNISIFIDPIDFQRYSPKFHAGAAVVIPRTRSLSAQQLDPKVKHFSRLSSALAELEAADIDPDAFPVMLDLDGHVTESTGANFFIVSNGVLKTSSDSAILQGVSRDTVFELAAQLGIPIAEEPLQPYDVYTAEEAFLCSTPFCLLPVREVDKRSMGAEAPGPITSQLLAAWSEMVGLDIVDQADERTRVLGSRGA
jgi:branched-chain amino acid aminotransferase